MEGQHEQLLVYSMVARGDVVLAEYSPFSTASFSTLASRASALVSASSAVRHVPPTRNVLLLSFTTDNVHTFHFLLQDQFRFVVVSKNLVERKIAFTCLQRMKDDFYKCYMGANNSTALLAPHALDKEFGSKLREHMEYCLDHFQRLQKLPSVRDQVQELKENVLENIKMVHESRIEIDELEALKAQEENFHRQGKKLRNQMWMKQAITKLVAIIFCLIVAFLIWVGICKAVDRACYRDDMTGDEVRQILDDTTTDVVLCSTTGASSYSCASCDTAIPYTRRGTTITLYSRHDTI
ncbi:hypothetical protein GOP47_0005148 [Adiantum capillus-veneris]|uniref:Uncharacterized protein n=1 Tax=Adiantum capillus-veneris TaxID=13818 RepID=A0A9D4V504_ADICA|nr:hypothetical protein GOP47_0005148 [Adiantum capillus-veneris]